MSISSYDATNKAKIDREMVWDKRAVLVKRYKRISVQVDLNHKPDVATGIDFISLGKIKRSLRTYSLKKLYSLESFEAELQIITAKANGVRKCQPESRV
jgi:hypothetical protein